MASNISHPGRSLADQLADLQDPTPKDFDPEDGGHSEGETSKSSDANAGQEHYQAVGKAKLRKDDPVELGKQYAGAHVSRDALEVESDEDPFAAPTSGSEDDQLSKQASDAEHEGMSSSGSSFSDQGEDGLAEVSAGSENDDISVDDHEVLTDFKVPNEGGKVPHRVEEFHDDPSSQEVEADFDDVPSDRAEREQAVSHHDADDGDVNGKRVQRGRHLGQGPKRMKDDREELRRLMGSDRQTMVATISATKAEDAAKGRAVKVQRTTFDSLLNARIKLQRGLEAMNEASASEGKTIEGTKDGEGEGGEDVDGEVFHSAEKVALSLWSTLESLRTTLADLQTKDATKKRKRPSPVSSTTSLASLWARLTDLEAESLPHRRKVIEKWSHKVRATSASLPNATGKLLGSAGQQQSITTVLDAHIANEIGERASKRSRTDGNLEPIYDDTVFYQSLLRDLVEQRMSSSAITNGLDILHQLPSRLPVHHVTGMRNDKVKRAVDTRASKGRKMKYNVHEKLQNFLAPEDRGSWTIRARDEFFASLLGRTASGLLGEGDESASDEDSEEDREERGLRLFRS